MTTLRTILPVLCIFLCISGTVTFDLHDPKTNLDSFVRTSASLDTKEQTVNYINGTVFYRLPGQTLKPLFFVEGYNIATKIKKDYGYLSLSREFLVYRDLHTGQILRVFANPISVKPNEVFFVANDPVNQNLTYGRIIPFMRMPSDRVTFNLDILLQYPNVLDPKNYSQYSAGDVYEADELFQYYTSYSRLADSNDSSVPDTTSWARRAQFLPWLALGPRPGNLYYIAISWKCLQGLGDVAPDIMQLVREKYPKYLHAPASYEVPNETSWSVFKKEVDARRARGDPDILLPLLNVTSVVPEPKNSLDERITSALTTSPRFTLYFNGSVYSEITYSDPNPLFNLVGHVDCDVTPTASGFNVTMEITGDYYDFATHEPLRKFNNPMTGDVDRVKPLRTTYTVAVDSSAGWPYSISVPHVGELSVMAEDSYSKKGKFGEDWAVHLVSLFFPEDTLTTPKPFFYGTVTRFSSWLPWMKMDATMGLMVYRLSLFRCDLT